MIATLRVIGFLYMKLIKNPEKFYFNVLELTLIWIFNFFDNLIRINEITFTFSFNNNDKALL